MDEIEFKTIEVRTERRTLEGKWHMPKNNDIYMTSDVLDELMRFERNREAKKKFEMLDKLYGDKQ